MKQYKVIYKEPLIPKDQIERHKDFDLLLKNYGAYKAKKVTSPKYKVLIGGGAMLVSFLFYFLMMDPGSSSNPLAPVEVVEQDHKNSVPSRDVSPQKSPFSSSTPITEKERVDVQPHSKAVDVPSAEPKELIEENEENRRKSVRKEQTQQSEEPVALKNSDEEVAASFQEAFPKEGMQNLYLYFNKALIYPLEEMNAKVEGTVILSFFINKEGRPENVEIVQPVSEGINEEAKRLIEEMPDWSPALVKGKAVNSRVTLPITFKITD